MPLVALDDRRCRLLIGAHHAPQILWVEALREVARADELAGHDRELAALGVEVRIVGRASGGRASGRLMGGAPSDAVEGRDRERTVDGPLAIVQDQPALIEQVVDGGREPLRMPAAVVVYRPGDAGCERVRREPPDEVGFHVGEREPLEGDLRGEPARLQALPGLDEGVAEAEGVGLERPDDEQPCRDRAPREIGERIERRGVAPVEVLEHEDERLRGRQVLDGLAELEQPPVPARVGRPSAQALGRGVVHPAGQLEQPPRGPARQRLDDVGALGLVAEPAQQVEHRGAAFDAALELEGLAARAADVAVGAQALEEVVEQGGLAGAGLARDEDDLAVAALCPRERFVQSCLLGLAPDEDRARRAALAGLDREAVAAARHRLQQLLGLAAERGADLTNADAQHGRADRRARPGGAQQLRVRDQSIRVLGEVEEDRRRLRAQRALAAAVAQAASASIEPEVSERDHLQSITWAEGCR